MIADTPAGFTFDAKLKRNSYVVSMYQVDNCADCFQIKLTGHVGAGVAFSCGSTLWAGFGQSFPRIGQVMDCIEHLSPRKLNGASLLFLSDSLSSWMRDATGAKTKSNPRIASIAHTACSGRVSSGLDELGDTTAVPRPWPIATVQFVAIAESGVLEAQSLMLCESIRLFGGCYADMPITLVSPREARRPSAVAIRTMEQLRVDYLPLDLESPCPEYGTSYRVLAASIVEQRSTATVLIQVDSDTIFLGEPDFDLGAADMLARPVDVKGICTTGAGDPKDEYWRELCRLCSVRYESIPWLDTTVDRIAVRANYNGGLVAVRRDRAIFRKTEELFLRIVSEKHHSHAAPSGSHRIGSGCVSPEGFTFWGTSQIALSLASTARDAPAKLLPSTYNIPLHFFDALAAAELAPVHVHYHWLCDGEFVAQNPLVDGRMKLPSRQTDWLHSKLQLDNLPTSGRSSMHL